MTTRVTIKNEENSNGDVHITSAHSNTDGHFVLLPGDSKELWITDSSAVLISETWPTKKKRSAA